MLCLYYRKWKHLFCVYVSYQIETVASSTKLTMLLFLVLAENNFVINMWSYSIGDDIWMSCPDKVVKKDIWKWDTVCVGIPTISMNTVRDEPIFSVTEMLFSASESGLYS